MLLTALRRTLFQIFSRPFRSVLWKSLGLTLVMLIAVWFGLDWLVSTRLAQWLPGWPWVATISEWLLGAGLIIGLMFLVAPVTSVFAGLFLDDIADAVDARHYPGSSRGQPLKIVPSLWLSAKFTGLVVAGNILALLLFLVPGINVVSFFAINGYLLGREYFQFSALRHLSPAEADRLRNRRPWPVFFAGLMIAAVVLVPLVNLLTPIFAAALMSHVFRLVEEQPVQA